jgi:hypothetical protein
VNYSKLSKAEQLHRQRTWGAIEWRNVSSTKKIRGYRKWLSNTRYDFDAAGREYVTYTYTVPSYMIELLEHGRTT